VSATLLLKAKQGLFFVPEDDFYTRTALTRTGDYSPGERRLLEGLCRPGDVLVDVGAHIGSLSIPLAARVGVGGRVICFEPQRTLFQIVCANAVANAIGNLEAHWAGVSSQSGTMWVEPLDPSTRNYGGRKLLTHAVHMAEKTRVVTLDSLNLSSCRLVKIDVEGMEESVLAGASALLEKQPFIYFENSFISGEDCVQRSQTLFKFFLQRGYSLYWHCPPIVEPEFEAIPVLRDGGSINVLAVPPLLKSEIDRDFAAIHDLRSIAQVDDVVYPKWLPSAAVTAVALDGTPWASVRRGLKHKNVGGGPRRAVQALVDGMNAAAAEANFVERLTSGTRVAWTMADLWLLHFDRASRQQVHVVTRGTIPRPFLAFLRASFDVTAADSSTRVYSGLRDTCVVELLGPDAEPGPPSTGKQIRLCAGGEQDDCPLDWSAGPPLVFSSLRGTSEFLTTE
jgi:FkbM family methyltransferase